MTTDAQLPLSLVCIQTCPRENGKDVEGTQTVGDPRSSPKRSLIFPGRPSQPLLATHSKHFLIVFVWLFSLMVALMVMSWMSRPPTTWTCLYVGTDLQKGSFPSPPALTKEKRPLPVGCSFWLPWSKPWLLGELITQTSESEYACRQDSSNEGHHLTARLS